MILYSVTVNIDKEVEEEWLQWMQSRHIPEVMETGYFRHFHLYRLLSDDQSGGTNYSIQYFADKLEDVENYLEHDAPRLMAKHNHRYQDRHAAFRTVLQRIT